MIEQFHQYYGVAVPAPPSCQFISSYEMMDFAIVSLRGVEDAMKAHLLAAVCLTALSTSVVAQERLVRLQCSGIAELQEKKLSGVPVEGLVLEIKNKTVTIAGSPGFDGTWEVTGEDAAKIYFNPPKNQDYVGWVNRYSGELHLSNMKNNQIMLAIVFANCRPAQQLF